VLFPPEQLRVEKHDILRLAERTRWSHPAEQRENVIMNAETKQVGMNELSETELDHVSGGDLIDMIDHIAAAFIGRDSEGRGLIHHFIDSGAHYK
jgi:bacteriocin-like protein